MSVTAVIAVGLSLFAWVSLIVAWVRRNSIGKRFVVSKIEAAEAEQDRVKKSLEAFEAGEAGGIARSIAAEKKLNALKNELRQIGVSSKTETQAETRERLVRLGL